MRIAGFLDSRTRNIVTSLEAKRDRHTHRGVHSLAVQVAKYRWVWQADQAGTLLGWHVEDGRLYLDAAMSDDMWMRVQRYATTYGLYRLSMTNPKEDT